ncbi:MAG: chemotaxis-specific protein-glutamate methyltransferase CheB [Rectinemataceae bacterium]|nr:chemotaxis-specific protein-glutamate methyltransferase CheB [Spirochaetaceae bacterium]
MKVLIVDDSVVSRQVLKYICHLAGDLEVVAEARDGYQALAYLDNPSSGVPDVITMDIEMPGMDGYETTSSILARYSIPIVIISNAYNYPSAEKALKALRAGAVAAVGKPPGFGSPNFYLHAREIADLLRNSATVRPRRPVADARKPSYGHTPIDSQLGDLPPFPIPQESMPKLIALGASTGGPPAVQEILSRLPADFPVPILVVQHIASGFAQHFATWLDNTCSIRCKLAEDGEDPMPGTVYIAPNDVHLIIGEGGHIRYRLANSRDLIIPSIDTLFLSVAGQCGRHAIGILLTGMGKDGAQGLLRLRQMGCITLAQDRESSVVYGMPGEAERLGAAMRHLPPERISDILLAIFGIHATPEREV